MSLHDEHVKRYRALSHRLSESGCTIGEYRSGPEPIRHTLTFRDEKGGQHRLEAPRWPTLWEDLTAWLLEHDGAAQRAAADEALLRPLRQEIDELRQRLAVARHTAFEEAIAAIEGYLGPWGATRQANQTLVDLRRVIREHDRATAAHVGAPSINALMRDLLRTRSLNGFLAGICTRLIEWADEPTETAEAMDAWFGDLDELTDDAKLVLNVIVPAGESQLAKVVPHA